MFKKVCIECKKEFVITDDDIAIYTSENIAFPDMCKECRQKARERIASQGAGISQHFTNDIDRPKTKDVNPSNSKYMFLLVAVLVGMFFMVSFFINSDKFSILSGSTSSNEELHQSEPNAIEDYNVPSDGNALFEKGENVNSQDIIEDSPVATGNIEDAIVDTGKIYHFRSEKQLREHFEKHGGDFTYATQEEYEAGACVVINHPDVLHKLEKEDNDDVYYLEDTNEFVIVSTDGYIRTYFKPNTGKKYYDKQ